jgi:hypothetical protein
MMDPRRLMLLIVFMPYVFWLGGLAGVIGFWNNPMLLLISSLVIILGFRFSITQIKMFHSIYARHFKKEIASLDNDADWLAMDLEILGTEGKMHILPDDCGIIFKKNNKVFIETIRGISFELNPSECVFVFTSKTSLACTITIINAVSGEPVFDYSITPHYKGSEAEIPAHSGKKARWFAEWFGCGIESTIDNLNV